MTTILHALFALLLLLFSRATLAQWAPMVDAGGVRLGVTTVTDAKQMGLRISGCRIRDDKQYECRATVRWGPTKANILLFAPDMTKPIWEIAGDFGSSDYFNVVDSLTKQYGQPISKEEYYSATWKIGTTTVVVKRKHPMFGGSSSLRMITDAAQASADNSGAREYKATGDPNSDPMFIAALRDFESAERDRHWETMRNVMQPVANGGNANAQYLVAWTYVDWVSNDQGRPVFRGDIREAVRYLKLAVAQKHAAAVVALGNLYEYGYRWSSLQAPNPASTFLKDEKAALQLWREAANWGHAYAMKKVARMYLAGKGVPQDKVFGKSLFDASNEDKCRTPGYPEEYFSGHELKIAIKIDGIHGDPIDDYNIGTGGATTRDGFDLLSLEQKEAAWKLTKICCAAKLRNCAN